MSRRIMTAMFAAFVALWGAGVPRFAHVMIAHRTAEGAVSVCNQCCSHCSMSRPYAESNRANSSEERRNDEQRSSETHDCAICDLLATLVSNVPTLPTASSLCEPVVEPVADAPISAAARFVFDPYAPRGPPVMA